MATAPAHTVRAPEGKDSVALCAHLPSADTHCTLVLCYFNPIIYGELYSSCQKYTFLFLFFLTNKVTAFPFLLTVKTGENDFCTFTFLQIYYVLIFTFLQLYHLHLLKGRPHSYCCLHCSKNNLELCIKPSLSRDSVCNCTYLYGFCASHGVCCCLRSVRDRLVSNAEIQDYFWDSVYYSIKQYR